VRTSGLLLSLSAILSVLLVTWLGAGDVADIVALRLLAYAAWLYGLLGLPALIGPEARKGSAGGLALLRGQGEVGPVRRGLGLSLRLYVGLLIAALPGVIVAAAVSSGFQTLLLRTTLVLLSSVFLALLALSLGAVGAIAERLSPSHPRWIAIGVVLLPFGLGFFWPNIPSLPGAFLWAFEGLIHWGSLSL
jgi:hypothetical protein